MEQKKIALGCDHIGFEMKNTRSSVGERFFRGPRSIVRQEEGNGSFVETTRKICTAIQEDECRLALLICGTGLGFCSVANQYWGIRAAHASECYTAERARKSLNAQILCIGCRVLALEYAKKVVDAFLDEPFSWDRASSVENLRLMEQFAYQRGPKPANVRWNMGFHPDDMGGGREQWLNYSSHWIVSGWKRP